MTLDDLKEILEDSLSSDYRITTDKSGRIIIHTGLIEDSDGELVDADEIEEEVDLNEDEYEVDFEELEEDDED